MRKLLFYILAFISFTLQAEDLTGKRTEDILKQSGLETTMTAKIFLDAWFEKGSNYRRVFSDEAPKILSKWLSIPITDYDLIEESTVGGDKFATLERSIKDKNGSEIKILIMVPHPSTYELAQSGLVPELNALHAPELKVLSTKQSKIHGLDADIYVHDKQDLCSVYIGLPRGSALRISGSCDKKQELEALAGLLRIDKLAKRLAS